MRRQFIAAKKSLTFYSSNGVFTKLYFLSRIRQKMKTMQCRIRFGRERNPNPSKSIIESRKDSLTTWQEITIKNICKQNPNITQYLCYVFLTAVALAQFKISLNRRFVLKAFLKLKSALNLTLNQLFPGLLQRDGVAQGFRHRVRLHHRETLPVARREIRSHQMHLPGNSRR